MKAKILTIIVMMIAGLAISGYSYAQSSASERNTNTCEEGCASISTEDMKRTTTTTTTNRNNDGTTVTIITTEPESKASEVYDRYGQCIKNCRSD